MELTNLCLIYTKCITFCKYRASSPFSIVSPTQTVEALPPKSSEGGDSASRNLQDGKAHGTCPHLNSKTIEEQGSYTVVDST